MCSQCRFSSPLEKTTRRLASMRQQFHALIILFLTVTALLAETAPCSAQKQQCENGIISLPANINAPVKICHAIEASDPQLANQLASILQTLNSQQVQIGRLIKNVNSVGENIELKRQGDMLKTLVARLDEIHNADSASTIRKVSDLTYGLDDLKDELERVKSNPETAQKTETELKGGLGDAIANLDFVKAHALLEDISKQLAQINKQLGDVSRTTSEIKTAVQMDLIAPAKIQAGLETADMSVLQLVASAGVSPSVLEGEFRQRSADGKSNVARRFFDASLHSSAAMQWFESELAHGLDPNLVVPGDYYPQEGLLVQATRSANFEAVQILLRRGASPHAYEDMFLDSAPNSRFLFPLSALAADEHLTLDQKREEAKEMLAAGVVIPIFRGSRSSMGSEMAEIKQLQDVVAPALGLSLPPSPSLCDQVENPICKKASQLYGEDWCKRIAGMPKELRAPLDGAAKPIFDVTLQYLLLITRENAYFLGFESGYSDYVLVEVAQDSSHWTVMRYMSPSAGMGLCKEDSGVRLDYCWRRIPLLRVAQTDEMRFSTYGMSWSLSRHACGKLVTLDSGADPGTAK
jgi:hypothetical protein